MEDTLARVGRRVVLATQLGLGKSVPLVNGFYRRAKAFFSSKTEVKFWATFKMMK